MLNNTFYYGEFEYPDGSGKMYKGSHKPLVSKALFEQIQQAKVVPNTKTPWGTKQFAFKDIFKCGTCGASITAEEKFKPTVDGGLNRHVYYRCTRKVDPTCREKAITEKELVEQLIEFIEKNTKAIKINSELLRAISRHQSIVQYSFDSRGIKDQDIDSLTEYAKYILTNGSYEEQIKLIKNIESVFVIRNRKLYVN